MIFWDNDGVLVDTEPVFFRATQAAAEQLGCHLSEAMFADFVLRRGGNLIKTFCEEVNAPEGTYTRLRSWRNQRYLTMLDSADVAIPGTADMVGRLADVTPMAIVTTSRQDHFDAVHRDLGFVRNMQFVLTRQDYDLPKPSPHPYIRAVERSGVRAEQCLAIEDSERGLTAALAAGVPCIVKPSSMLQGGTFDGALQVVHSNEQLEVAVRHWLVARAC